MGTWTRGVYTREQQDRLGVDEDGTLRALSQIATTTESSSGWQGALLPLDSTAAAAGGLRIALIGDKAADDVKRVKDIDD